MLRNLIRQYGIEGVFILVLLISVMLSVYVTVAVCLSIIVYMFASRKFSGVVHAMPRSVVWNIAVFCVMALIVAIAYKNKTGVYIALGVGVVVLTGMFLRRFMTRELFESGISICCWLSIACFGVALFQLFVYGGDSSYRIPSTFMNANYYAMVIEFVVTLCLYKILSMPKGNAGLVLRYCFIILINIVGLYISGSRSGLMVTLSVFLLMFLLYKRYSLFWIALGILAAYAIIGLHYPDILLREARISHDLDNRLSIWRAALEGIATHPLFGEGGNAYARIYAVFDGYKARHAHNLILDTLLNYGIAGFGMVLGGFAGMFKLMRNGKSDARIRHLIYTVCWCVLVHGLMDVTILWIQTAILFLFIFSGGVMREHRDFIGALPPVATGLGGTYLSPSGLLIQMSHRTESRQ